MSSDSRSDAAEHASGDEDHGAVHTPNQVQVDLARSVVHDTCHGVCCERRAFLHCRNCEIAPVQSVGLAGFHSMASSSQFARRMCQPLAGAVTWQTRGEPGFSFEGEEAQ